MILIFDIRDLKMPNSNRDVPLSTDIHTITIDHIPIEKEKIHNAKAIIVTHGKKLKLIRLMVHIGGMFKDNNLSRVYDISALPKIVCATQLVTEEKSINVKESVDVLSDALTPIELIDLSKKFEKLSMYKS
jgi:hypothetical protein